MELVIKNSKSVDAGRLSITNGVVYWDSKERGRWECEVDDFIQFLETEWGQYAKVMRREYPKK